MMQSQQGIWQDVNGAWWFRNQDGMDVAVNQNIYQPWVPQQLSHDRIMPMMQVQYRSQFQPRLPPFPPINMVPQNMVAQGMHQTHGTLQLTQHELGSATTLQMAQGFVDANQIRSAYQPLPQGAAGNLPSMHDTVIGLQAELSLLRHQLVAAHHEIKRNNELNAEMTKELKLMKEATTEVVFSVFITQEGNYLTEPYSFNVASIMGNIDPNETMFPCTGIGNSLLNGYLGHAQFFYIQGLCWAGKFDDPDLVVLDGILCKLKMKPTAPLSLVNLKLDLQQWKVKLLDKFKTVTQVGAAMVEMYPPYFEDLISIMENPPKDFDSLDDAGKLEYLEQVFTHAAAATEAERMMALVNFWQFGKALTKNGVTVAGIEKLFTVDELEALWIKIMHGDPLLDKVYQDGKPIRFDSNNDRIEVCTVTVTDHGAVLRHLFMHVPELTVDPSKTPSQLLQTHRETDLVIAFYYKNFLPKFLRRIRTLIKTNPGDYPLLEALWEFFVLSKRRYQPA